MEKTRPILYGVADYAEIRRANAWFVDRTAKIRDLEATRYAMFLRPRRFGKSLLLSILRAYYDVQYADRFEEFFSGTDIGADPTDERGRYLVLYFNFSAVSKDVREVQSSFNDYASLCCDTFVRNYGGRLPDGLAERVLSAAGCINKLSVVTQGLIGTGVKLYVLIDEYDNFTNTILAESGLDAYNDLCHGDGFFKQFFANLKDAATGTEAPVTRLFVTGVSPVTMDDVTSGFNIATNISLDPQFADLTGFRHDDLRAIADYYGAQCGFDADKAYDAALTWYDNYRFGSADAPTLANTTLVLFLFGHLWRTHQFPDNMIDANLRTDYAKIRHIVTVDRRLNGNFHVLENLLAGGSLEEPLVESFQARELTKKENFTSLLYWLGITTITGNRRGKTSFGIPNEALKELAAKMIPDAYSDIYKIDGRIFDINSGLVDFSFDGNWKPFIDILSCIVKENFAVRASVEGEKVVQSTLVALLTAARGPYYVRHEREAGGGFYDIALKPRLETWPDIAHAALVEMKYVKAGDPAPTAEQLADIKAKAVVQLDRYSSDSTLNSQLTTLNSSVALHRLVLVFHGGDCVMAEEVFATKESISNPGGARTPA
ncbi:MAG: AAA family ATPase, partial [Kiritimatiellae bacterium]|nr:AAA family ATPase [Kiritimatiellia bacterium]